MQNRRPALALGLLAVLLAACGGTSAGQPPAPSPTGGLPADQDALVLQMRSAGGLMAPDYEFRDLPRISVYADGRVIVEAATREVHPGSLLPPLVEGRISAEQIGELLGAASAAGLVSGIDASYPSHGVFDAPATTFVTWSPGGLTRTSFGALGIGREPEDPAEAAAREKAVDFLPRLVELAESVGSEPYVPGAIRLAIRPYTVTDPAYVRDPVPWPLDRSLASAGAPIIDGSPEAGRCVVVTGDDPDTLWPVLAAADGTTPFVSDGERFALVVRPLLPDEPPVCR